MTPEAADQLARRYVDHWRHGSTRELTAFFETLDEEPAVHTFEQLRDRQTNPPGIPTFRAVYRGITNPHPNHPIAHACRRCGDGWVTVEFVHNSRSYRGCRPCSCHAGRLNEPGYNRILNGVGYANEATVVG